MSIEASILAGFHLKPLENVYGVSKDWNDASGDYWEDEEDEEYDGAYEFGEEVSGGLVSGPSGVTEFPNGNRAPQQNSRVPDKDVGSPTSIRHSQAPSNSGGPAITSAPLRDKLLDSYRDRIYFGNIEQVLAEGVTRHTGRDDRATVEQVLDPRTRMILFKLLAQGFISRICGCVSTGKEANVYYAERPGGQPPVALKIFKTSILVFKDRDRYVSGEFRFRSGYSRSNPRKMVKLWAEKEMRNLKRLRAAGLPVPNPLLLRLHVLAMDFLGVDGWPSPRLKDAAGSIPLARLAEAYIELLDAMRAMWDRGSGLVHGDLSEYNVLWHKGGLAIIDVSQSVESDHPRALEFLRMDCTNVGAFFSKLGVSTLSPRDCFDYVVHTALNSREEEVSFLEAARARAEARSELVDDARSGDHSGSGSGDLETVDRPSEGALEHNLNQMHQQAAVEEAVFMASYIPRSLSHVRDVELEVENCKRGALNQVTSVYHSAFTGVRAGGGGKEVGEEEVEEEDSGVDDEEVGEKGSGDDKSEKEALESVFFVGKDATKEEKKAHKATVKEAARERRKNKLKKHVKRKACSSGK